MPYYEGYTKFETYIRFRPSAAQQAEVEALANEIRRRQRTEDLSNKEYGHLDDVLTRCQIILWCGCAVPAIVKDVGWNKQRVCRTIHAFEKEGVAALLRRPGHPADPERETEIIAELQLLHEQAGFTTPSEYHVALNERIDPPISLPRCRHYLRKAGIRFRKSPRKRPNPSL